MCPWNFSLIVASNLKPCSCSWYRKFGKLNQLQRTLKMPTFWRSLKIGPLIRRKNKMDRSLGGKYPKHRMQNLCSNTGESTPPSSRRDSFRIPFWFAAFNRHCQHGLLCVSAPGEELWSADITDVHLLGSPEGLQQGSNTSNVGQSCPFCMSVSLHISDPYVPRWNAGSSELSWCPLRSVSNRRWL